MKCIIPCAGKSTRMNSNIPKVLLKVGSRTLLGHITLQWSDLVDGYVIVVSRENELLIRQHSGKAEFVVQDPLKGIADAILQTEPYVSDNFVVALGDCLHNGKFRWNGSPKQGIGVWKTGNLLEVNKSYLVDVERGQVKRVIEKPNMHPSDVGGPLNCGMGVYFFDRRVFDYIRKTPPSTLRNEVEITNVIQNMIDSGEKITPIWFTGKYINITYPEDIKKAEEVLK